MLKRAYDATERRRRADALTEQILDVVLRLAETDEAQHLSLARVSEAVEVSVPTLTRRFNNKDGLYAAAFRRAREVYGPNRIAAGPGEDRAAWVVRSQLSIYERWGRTLLYLRTQESSWHVVSAELEVGRRERRRWLAKVYDDVLGRSASPGQLSAQLFLVTDVHTWAVFRIDLGMSRQATATAMVRLLAAITREDSR